MRKLFVLLLALVAASSFVTRVALGAGDSAPAERASTNPPSTEAASTAPAPADPAALEARLAGQPDDVALLVQTGSAWLNLAVRGDKNATERAADLLERAVKLAPDSPQIRVLHGTALTLKGRDATLPLMKMRHVQSGLEEMDKAVALAPLDVSIRMQRGMTCANLPAVFARADTALADFRQLQAIAERAPGTVPENLVAEAGRQIARILAERGQGN